MALEEMLYELDSLGISVKRNRKKDLDTKEVADLIEILKMKLYRDYKTIYDEENH